MRKLTSQKEALKMEMNSLKVEKGVQNLSIGERAQKGIIPAGTEIKSRLIHAPDGRLLVEIEVTNDLVIFLGFWNLYSKFLKLFQSFYYRMACSKIQSQNWKSRV